ncbi:MAG: TetR/AcrR family transcriptional regulator [Thermoguttaceae bacterium]|nr:TetR/AcrR family transcriptional regulator [Thermoguttaceae bacterium]MDW8037913.1 TetR/AcrR family transcriptional regulator [Thermoguttaceae bacterium]
MSNLAERCRELAASAMKDGIANAALEVLRQYGYTGMTMERVADSAGVSKGSLYNYFRNKEELISFVFERIVEPAVQESQRIMAQPLGAVQKLEAMLRMLLEYFSQHRSLFDFLFHDAAIRELCMNSRRTKHDLATSQFESILRQGMQEGVFRPHEAKLAAEMLFGAVMFLIERQLELGERRPPEELVRHLLDVFLHGIRFSPSFPAGAE